jgi:hypothetical protein
LPTVQRASRGRSCRYSCIRGIARDDGLSVGTIIRTAAGAIAVLVAILFVLPGVAAALPASIEHTVQEYWPTQAGAQVATVVHTANTLSHPGPVWRMNVYRLIVGSLVLAIVIPAWVVGVQAMWLVAIACILVVVGAVIAGTRVLSIREWLHH